MRVLADYGLQFGRYRITQIAKQKKNNMITQMACSWMFGVASSWPRLVWRIWRGSSSRGGGCMADGHRL